MHHQFIVSSALILCAFAYLSCASTDQLFYNEPVTFDASSYINPEDYGYDLTINNKANNSSVDSSFIPISYKGKNRGFVEYPREARMNNIEGKVILQVYVDSTGTILNIDMIQSPGRLLTKSSIQAIMNTELTPATLNGQPVNSFARFPFVFRIQ